MKTNMKPQNGGLEDHFPFQPGDFQVEKKRSSFQVEFSHWAPVAP